MAAVYEAALVADMTSKASTMDCRLCGGLATNVFNQTILRKYEVGYYRCATCSSLQTEDAYWLDEAYRNSLSCLDTGRAQRNLNDLAACFFVSKLYKLKNIIDFGGGDGLLCRFLRDYGLNCFVKDKYAAPTYAQGFTEPNFQKPDLVIAFEVLEHFSNPEKDLDDLFSSNPQVLFASTKATGGTLRPKPGSTYFLQQGRPAPDSEQVWIQIAAQWRFCSFCSNRFAVECQICADQAYAQEKDRSLVAFIDCFSSSPVCGERSVASDGKA
jgi:hypothetical protein